LSPRVDPPRAAAGREAPGILSHPPGISEIFRVDFRTPNPAYASLGSVEDGFGGGAQGNRLVRRGSGYGDDGALACL